MRRGSIIGYDLNENTCQISYYDEKSDEPETFDGCTGTVADPSEIRLYKRTMGIWKGSRTAGTENSSCVVSDLFGKAVQRKKVRIGSKVHDAVWLLAKFVGLTLEDFEDIRFIYIYNSRDEH